MHRHGLIVLIPLMIPMIIVASACERSQSSTSPEPTPTVSNPTPRSEPEPERDVEPEADSEPEDPEIDRIDEPVFSRDGFEARGLKCSLNTPTRSADRYIAAGLVDADAALDACAPKGAAVQVSWEYVGGGAANITVDATSSKLAKCVATAMTQVRAGVGASCSAILLIGDPAGATAAFDAR
jgi:hypothetical protein